MKTIESTGKTREEAIQNGLRELGVDMHDIERIDVIDEGSRGFLGIGARPVRVRLTVDKPEDPPQRGGGNRQERPDRRGGKKQGQRGDGRPERQQQEQRGERQQQERQGGPKRREPAEQQGEKQGERQDAGKRKNKRRRGGDGPATGRDDGQQRGRQRDGGQRDGGQQGGGQRDGGQQGGRQAAQQNRKPQGNAHKAHPITDKRNRSVTDEATEALRRAESFESGADDGGDGYVDELPPDAQTEEVIETITDEQGKEAAAMLSEVLALMELSGSVTFDRASDGSARLAIDSEADGGILIGKRGVTLHSIQYLVNRMIAQNEAGDNTERVVVDVGGYVDRRRNTLADMARTMARRAKDSGRNVRLKPLSPQERRIVHLTLEPDPHVRTYSLGDSLFRSIIINPVGGRGGGNAPNRRDRGPRQRNRNNGDTQADA